MAWPAGRRRQYHAATASTAAARVAAVAATAVLLTAAGAANAANGDAPFRQRCEALSAGARVTFASHDNGYRIDNTLSYRSLTRMKQPAVARGLVLGLTRTESRVALKAEGGLLVEPGSGVECVIPRVAVTLYYQPIVIYVGSEFAPGTCSYREILAHEMRHLKSYLDYLPKVEERFRDKLGRSFAGKPLYASRGQSRALLQSTIERNWMPYIKAEMARVEQLQIAIDSPGEYARLSKVCQGEVQSLIGSTRRSST